MLTAEKIIEHFGMKPLPSEGGYYVETYRCAQRIPADCLPPTFTSDRNLATAILYLITPEGPSLLHRIAADEVFHFYLGDPVDMLRLYPDGSNDIATLGPDILAGHSVQLTVPAGCWQGCTIQTPGQFALMGTTVSPGFEFADYRQGRRADLLDRYPDRREMIIRLTREQ